MKKLLILIMVLLICSIAEAKMYVTLDKNTGTPKGVVDIDKATIGQWSERYIMVEADESYRGLQGCEVKIDGNKPRKATNAEIAEYKAGKAAEQVATQKQAAMDTLGLTAEDLEKIKKLPDTQ